MPKLYRVTENNSMGKAVIGEELFPRIIEQYNTCGKTSTYDYLRSKYGIKHPYFVIKRIRECGKYTYNPETEQLTESCMSNADNVFMDLDELCGTAVARVKSSTTTVADNRSGTMEKLVHELISDRLLTLSKYITLDSSTRTILIDQTSLFADGYQVITH